MGHEYKFKQTELGDDCHLGNITFGHWDLVVPFEKVDTRNNTVTGHSGSEIQ